MRLARLSIVVLSLIVALAALQLGRPRDGWSYLIGNFWPDGDNIVMDDVFLPANVWSSPAQFQLSEWNEVDTTDNSHPFRINLNPQFSFGADDGDNTMGFLGEAGLMSEYGLSYASALAWTVCWSGGASGRYDECDMMLDPALPWQLVPDSNNFFQSTVLHEAGHIRGLDHYNNYLSMQNSGVDKILRGENLYMDDKEGVRQNATHVSESDMVIYNKFHNGSVPLWMSSGPTTARVGDTISFINITVENRGTNALGPLRFGTYLSTNTLISTSDQLLNTGSWDSFGRFTFSTFNWSVTVPPVNDCGTYYVGGIIDDNNAHAERFEGNNAVAFSNSSPDPQPFTILLERDSLEPNDSFVTARAITLPFSNGNLTIDADVEQDFYRFTLTQPSRVSIAVSFTHAAGDVDIDLRNGSDVVLQSSTSTTNTESLVRDLEPGTYYIRVYGFGAGSCNRYAMTANATLNLPSVTLVATDAVAGEAGTDPGTFTVSRTGATTSSLPVNYTVSGTATAGSDYTALSGGVIIPAGSASTTIAVTPIDDALFEGSETVIVTLAASAGYTVGAASAATVTITDNDRPRVTIVASDSSATEAGRTTGAFRVTRTGTTAASLTVVYSVTGTATPGSDYTALSGSVIIPAGLSTADILVTPVNDLLLERNETVIATLAPNAAYTIGSPRSATVRIISDEKVSIAAFDATATEAGPTTGAFRVTRTGSTAGSVTVVYSVTGTATPGSDYTALSGSVVIPAGLSTAVILVTPVNDLLLEGDETVIVTLAPNAAYTIGSPRSATVRIVSDERVSIAAFDATATEAGPTTGAFRVTRTGSTAGSVTVVYSVTGTATPGSDYTALSGSVVIPAGLSAADILVTPINDLLLEGNETVIATLAPNAAYTIGSPSSATVRIISNE
jgi:Calx-beta domain-containing protein/pre-peptidase